MEWVNKAQFLNVIMILIVLGVMTVNIYTFQSSINYPKYGTAMSTHVLNTHFGTCQRDVNFFVPVIWVSWPRK